MIKALKGSMTVYGVLGTFFGLAYVFLPRQSAALFGFDEVSAYLVSTKIALGASLITVGLFVIIAARDPLKNTLWVKFSIVFAVFFFAVAIYSVLAGYTDLSQSITGITIHGGFAIIQLISYRFSDLSWVYDLLYRNRAPWEMNEPRPELVKMVESGKLTPSRAIDLGCGTGDNAIYLAKHGFEVVGVDLSPRAIDQAKEKSKANGSFPKFSVGDVTDLKGITGVFDLVLDYGCLGCVIGNIAREKYVNTLLKLTHPGSQYILANFVENPERRLNLIPNALPKGEVDRLLGHHFETVEYNGQHETGPLGLSLEFRLMRRL